MKNPSHDDIAQKAYQLWQERGSVHGTHDELWLEAEQELKKDSPAAKAGTNSSNGHSPAKLSATVPLTPALPSKQEAVAAAQKEAARAPQVPHHVGPKSKPAETGKPVWPKPHSS